MIDATVAKFIRPGHDLASGICAPFGLPYSSEGEGIQVT
jgi:hypothetical protein